MPLFAFELKYQVRSGPEGKAGLQAMRLAFERADGHLRDSARHIGPFAFKVFESYAKRQFRGQGIGPNRGKWSELSDGYKKWKARAYPGAPILVRTGRLRSSLTEAGSVDAKRRLLPHGFEYGTRVQYAHYHQLGTIHMVDRPVFDFDERFEKGLRVAVLKGVRQALVIARVSENADTRELDERIGRDEEGGD